MVASGQVYHLCAFRPFRTWMFERSRSTKSLSSRVLLQSSPICDMAAVQFARDSDLNSRDTKGVSYSDDSA